MNAVFMAEKHLNCVTITKLTFSISASVRMQVKVRDIVAIVIHLEVISLNKVFFTHSSQIYYNKLLITLAGQPLQTSNYSSLCS